MDDSRGDAGEPASQGQGQSADAPSYAEPQLQTFLIADIRGYTRFTQTRGDEAAALLAARFAELVFAGVASHGGRLLELRGDEALVVFGSARQALRAAVELQERFAEECVNEPSLPLRVGIGIDAGEAVPVGDGFRGAALNRAARLCSHAQAGEVLATEGVQHLAGMVEEVRYSKPESLRLKGMERPVKVARVVAGAPTRRAVWSWRLRHGARRLRASRLAWAGAAVIVLAAAAALALVDRSSSPPTFSKVAPNSLAMLDGAGRIRAVKAVGATPSHVAFGFGSLWVTNHDDDTVVRLDPKTHFVQQTIGVGHGPTGIAVAGGSVWVANSSDGTLSRIDPGKQRVVDNPRIGNGPTGVVAAGRWLWVALAGDQRVLRFDPQTGAKDGEVKLATSPAELAAGGGAVWASSPASSSVYRIELDAPYTLTETPVGLGASGLAFGFGSLWVANTSDGTVSRIEPTTARELARPHVGNAPTALAVTEAGIWMTDRHDHSVVLIDPSHNRVARRIELGAEPEPILAYGSSVWIGTHTGQGGHRGGTFTVLLTYFEPKFDPAIGYTPYSWSAESVLYDGLVGFARSGPGLGVEVVPDLAVAIPRPSADHKTWPFHLRRGIRYSDGSPVEASDVRHGIERGFEIGGAGATYYSGIVGAQRCRKKHPCDLSRGIAVDDRAGTITFSLTAPDDDFLRKLALPFATAVPAGIGSVAATGRNPVPATGAYMVSRSLDRGQGLVLARNPYFREWSHAAQPDGFPNQIVFRAGDDTDPGQVDRAVTAVLRGEADMLLSTPPTRIHEIETRYPALLHRHPTSSVLSVFLNTHEPPFDDVHVRQALNYALDRSRMIVSLGGRPEQVTCQLFPPNFPGYEPYCPYTKGPKDGTWHGPDLKRARRLVAASGTAGMRVTVVIPKSFRSYGDAGAVVVAALRRLGYDARQTVIDNDRYHKLTERHGTRVQVGHVYSFGLDYPAASGELNTIYRCLPGVDDQFGYRDATTCAMIRRARTLASQGLERQANAAWAKVDRRLVDRAPFAAYAVIETTLIVSRRVRNYHYSPILGVLVGQAQVR